MGKYDIKLVMDYVEGNDITGYDIEELENDYKFMRDVIMYTNDKRMYLLSSKNVRSNYDFANFVIDKFKKDINFVCYVADNYIQNSEDIEKRLDLAIKMRDLTKFKNDDLYYTYLIFLNKNYLETGHVIKSIKQKNSDNQDFLNEIGMGFGFVENEYGSSDRVVKFFAEQMVAEILLVYNSKLEKILHQNFDSFDDVEIHGIKNYMLDFIKKYDHNLSEYAASHMEVLNYFKEELDDIKSNWDSFNIANENKRYDLLIDCVQKYMIEHEDDCTFTGLEMLYYVGNELGVAEQIKKHDVLDDEEYEELMNNMLIDKSQMSFIDLKHYYNIREIMLEFLTPKVVDEPGEKYDNYINKEKISAKVIKYDFSKRLTASTKNSKTDS